MKYKKVLAIAGSDPSGGAGIQADLKTFTSLGVYGSAVITGLTVQNTRNVKDVLYLPPQFVKEQIQTVLEDIDISYIKTGMLGNAETAEAAGKAVKGYFIICDPVMVSKSGKPLLQDKAVEALKKHIIAQSTILTPNYHELMRLTDMKYKNPLEAGQALLEKYDHLRALLVKGGHIEEEEKTVTDTLLIKEGKAINNYNFPHPRIKTVNTHGTGCTLSSAITAYLARGEKIKRAVYLAVDYVFQLIKLAARHKIGKGNGALPHYLIRN